MATTTESLPQEIPGTHYSLAQWMELKSSYIQGKGTLKKLCNSMGMNYETAKTKSCHEKWEKKQATWVKARELKLGIGEEIEETSEPIPNNNTGSELETTERQLRLVNHALEMSIFPRDIADLTKAKATLVETLSILRTGCKPGTNKPEAQKKRRPSYQDDTEPVQVAPVALPVIEPSAVPQVVAGDWASVLF